MTLSTRNASSSGNYFNFDYFDQWDGSLLPAGRYETPFATTWNWTEYASGIASGGSYYSAGSSNAMWHAFTSDAVTYQALASNSVITVEVSIDGITRGLVSLYNPTVITRTFDYGGLGVGPHVLQVRAVNGTATVDAFITAAFFPTATHRTVITYAYDPLYRLMQATATGALTYTFEYDYDAVGNRTVQTRTITSTQVTAYQYDVGNRLTSVNGQTYTWDDNGNLVSDGEKIYTYNQANRLTDLTQGATTFQFNYNGDGVRLQQVINSTITTYTQDLAAPLPVVLQSQTDESAVQYVYALGTRPLAQYDTEWEYLLADALGSVRQIANANGNVALAESYEPYGSVLSSNGTASSIFGYSGEQVDTTGLIYLRARYMQPTLGIFLAKDPWSGNAMRSGSMNGWSYANDAPINYTDASGLAPDCDDCYGPPVYSTLPDESMAPLPGPINQSVLPPNNLPGCQILQYTVHREILNRWRNKGDFYQKTVIEIVGHALDHCFFNQWATDKNAALGNGYLPKADEYHQKDLVDQSYTLDESVPLINRVEFQRPSVEGYWIGGGYQALACSPDLCTFTDYPGQWNDYGKLEVGWYSYYQGFYLQAYEQERFGVPFIRSSEDNFKSQVMAHPNPEDPAYNYRMPWDFDYTFRVSCTQ